MTGRSRLSRALVLAMLIGIALGVAGCGRKAVPQRPEDSTFPRPYPYYPEHHDPRSAPGTSERAPAPGSGPASGVP